MLHGQRNPLSQICYLLTISELKPGQQLSQIEKSVTHLLIATKQLLETLTQWSRHNATEGEVSDVYVRLGYEFNIACRAFSSIGVETADLGPVPELLRTILEETLSQEASSASLDKFLPRIRDIIISLLHGLKRKQQKLRSKQVKDSGSSTNTLNSPSSGSLNTGITQMLEDVPTRKSGSRGPERRVGSGASTLSGDTYSGDGFAGDEGGVPPRFQPVHPVRQDSSIAIGESSGRSVNRESGKPFHIQLDATANNPSLYNSGQPQHFELEQSNFHRTPSQRSTASVAQPLPPPPPPKQQDALAALQRGGDLERRASRRYSAYQISKHLGASPNGVPMIPPAQNSPIPNRGRDLRESMNAVRVRGSGIHMQQRNNPGGESSPVRNNNFAHRISEESNQSSDSYNFKPPTELPADDSPIAKTPEDKLRIVDTGLDLQNPKYSVDLGEQSINSAQKVPSSDANQSGGAEPTKRPDGNTTEHHGKYNFPNEMSRLPSGDILQSQQFIPEQSPQPDKEFTLFLQYKSKIKKFVLPDGANDLSIARLQLAFIEKFAWNTHSNGNDLPEIYMQDPVSGVRHELEDLSDVKDRSVLVLNVEVLDEVKKHIDEGLGGLRRMVEGVRTVVDGQQTAIQRFSERQQDTEKEMVRLAATPKAENSRVSSAETSKINGFPSSTSPKNTLNQISSVHSLRQDLAIVRQTFSSVVSDLNSSISTVNAKASTLKAIVLDGAISSFDASSGRSYVNVGKKLLGEDSEKIVNRVDDLQDVVEDLRKDVVTRGVRPLPRQLETVSKSISTATAELKKMQEYLKREKPVWTKIWEKELQLVCNDRDLLTMQEELAADLEDDLEKATQTFALVEQATKQQNIQSSQGNNPVLRNTSKGLTAIATDQDVDPVKAKDGVLGEVRALRPNHETRLEAIERAEKARQRELESRREGEFTKELGTFVEEGKLKKSGGVEEAERQRKAKDEKIRREAWEKEQEGFENNGKEVGGTLVTTEHQEIPSENNDAVKEANHPTEAPGQAAKPGAESQDSGEFFDTKFIG